MSITQPTMYRHMCSLYNEQLHAESNSRTKPINIPKRRIQWEPEFFSCIL